jgi:Uma2 family endonuclease
MAALPNLITVEEFRQLPDSGEYCYELHHGEVAAMTRPKSGHVKLQRRLEHLLQSRLASFGEVCMEWPYRAVGEFDLRVADVALVSRARWDSLHLDDDLRGAPELVVEVISPSNTKSKMRQTVSLCLANGAFECWLVDPKKRSITVVRKDGATSVYESDAQIPLVAFGGDSLSVRDIFAE